VSTIILLRRVDKTCRVLVLQLVSAGSDNAAYLVGFKEASCNGRVFMPFHRFNQIAYYKAVVNKNITILVTPR